MAIVSFLKLLALQHRWYFIKLEAGPDVFHRQVFRIAILVFCNVGVGPGLVNHLILDEFLLEVDEALGSRLLRIGMLQHRVVRIVHEKDQLRAINGDASFFNGVIKVEDGAVWVLLRHLTLEVIKCSIARATHVDLKELGVFLIKSENHVPPPSLSSDVVELVANNHWNIQITHFVHVFAVCFEVRPYLLTRFIISHFRKHGSTIF